MAGDLLDHVDLDALAVALRGAAPERLELAEAVERVLSGSSRRDGRIDDFETMAATIGAAAVASDDAERLKAWWAYRMLFTPDPLAERLALMWHNHFATSNLKVDNL